MQEKNSATSFYKKSPAIFLCSFSCLDVFSTSKSIFVNKLGLLNKAAESEFIIISGKGMIKGRWTGRQVIHLEWEQIVLDSKLNHV